MLAFHRRMLESVRSLTTLFDTPLQLPPAAFHLLIMGPDLFLAQALPKNGNLTIGRADNADIRITDPLASRLHARLHVTEGLFEIEDIGSINRTKVRDVALAELRKLDRQEGPLEAAQFDGPDADDLDIEMFGQDRVEFRDAAGPRVEVVPGNAIDHQIDT